MENGHPVLEEMLEPVTRCFNTEVAQALVSLRIDERAQARVDELAGKANEGMLTPQEQREYETYINASTLIGILQAKARRMLGPEAA